jgi:hypothetical protein
MVKYSYSGGAMTDPAKSTQEEKFSGADGGSDFKELKPVVWPSNYQPSVYHIDTGILADQSLKIWHSTSEGDRGESLEGKYFELIKRVVDEGLVEVQKESWARPLIKTKRHTYSFEDFDGDTDLSNLFVLDCQIYLAAESTASSSGAFYFIEQDHVVGDMHEMYSFFVAQGGKVYKECFGISRTFDEKDLVERRILVPYEVDPFWARDSEWFVARTRHNYREFYETTEWGRLYCLRPDAVRFDNIRYWAEPDGVADISRSAAGTDCSGTNLEVLYHQLSGINSKMTILAIAAVVAVFAAAF